jgi:hypothetical protein
MQDAQDRYKYADLPLSPAIAEELILEKFSGQVTARQTIVEEINRLHIARGGKPAEAVDLGSLVKKALKKLLDSGSAENPSQGYWRIGPEASETEDDASDSQGVSAQVVFEPLPAADVVLGAQADEKGAVYLYYLPAYRLQSEAENATVWPCKIGWTDRDPLVRILSQAATALPEKPHVALIVYTEHPLALEAAIHGVLTLRGRKVDNSPGKEWFLTSPEDVKTLVEFFDPRFKNR